MIKNHTKKNILALYLGGARQPFSNRGASTKWFTDFIELQMVANVDFAVITLGKKETEIPHFQRALRRVQREWNKYDGFVLSLPYSDYIYHSNIVSYMLGASVEKPIVFTTSLEFSDFKERADMQEIHLMTNMLNAAVVASTGLAGSTVVGGKNIVPAAHAQHTIIDGKDIIDSLDGVAYGYIDFGVQLADDVSMGDGSKPTLSLDVGEGVERFRLAGDAAVVSDELARLQAFSGRAAIIEGGADLSLSLTQKLPENVPALMIADQTLLLYEKEKLSPVEQLTPASAAAKFLCLFGKGQSLRQMMKKECIGELLHDGVV